MDHDPDRRTMLGLGGAAVALVGGVAAVPAVAEPRSGAVSALGLDASQFGVRSGSSEDQTVALQRALDRAAAAGSPLALAPGVYRVGGLRLPNGTRLVAPSGASRLLFSGGASLLSAQGAERIALSGLVLDGQQRPLPENRGLLQVEDVEQFSIRDCEITASGGHGLLLAAAGGDVTGNAITGTADVAVLSRDGRGLTIARNTLAEAGNNGIQIVRSQIGEDGTQVLDNRISKVRNRSGGNGPYGNAINVFRAGGVIVRGNRIAECTFSGVRGNSASNLQIVGNTVTEAGETALYVEFQFEAAVVAQNIVDGAQTGVSVTNFNEGGRLAVVQGNIVRNLTPRPSNPDPEFLLGVGIYVEADTAVSGNVVERASAVGIAAGWGRHLRDVALSGNVVRNCGVGIGASVATGAGSLLISGNVITGSRRGAIMGLDRKDVVTGDLARGDAGAFPHLSIADNRVM